MARNNDYSYEAQIIRWLDKVKGVANLSVDDQLKVTKAGAEAFRAKLRANTPVSKKPNPAVGHMRDHITLKNRNPDNVKDGSYTAGWQFPKGNKLGIHARKARWLNDGTRKIEATHFVDNVRDNPSVKSAIAKAESDAYQKLVERKMK